MILMFGTFLSVCLMNGMDPLILPKLGMMVFFLKKKNWKNVNFANFIIIISDEEQIHILFPVKFQEENNLLQ